MVEQPVAAKELVVKEQVELAGRPEHAKVMVPVYTV
jgi:hypothetical protein